MVGQGDKKDGVRKSFRLSDHGHGRRSRRGSTGGRGKPGKGSKAGQGPPWLEEMRSFEMDCDLLVYKAEKEGKNVEEVKEQVRKMKQEKRAELVKKHDQEQANKLDEQLEEYKRKSKMGGTETAAKEESGAAEKPAAS